MSKFTLIFALLNISMTATPSYCSWSKSYNTKLFVLLILAELLTTSLF